MKKVKTTQGNKQTKLPCCQGEKLFVSPSLSLSPPVMSNANIGRESLKTLRCFCMTNDELPTLCVPDKQNKRS